MKAICDMMHRFVEEIQQKLVALLMMKGWDRSQFSVIRWEELEDDHSEDRVRYSFLMDEQNK